MDASVHVIDYVIFCVVIVGSLLIGVYYSFSQKSSSEYLQGRRQLGLLPVSISMMVSFISAVTMQASASDTWLYMYHYRMSLYSLFCVQGVPGEVYTRGLYQFLPNIVSITASFLAIWTFVPVFYNLNLISTFQVKMNEISHKATVTILFWVFCSILRSASSRERLRSLRVYPWCATAFCSWVLRRSGQHRCCRVFLILQPTST